jgi:hypothetical protein
MRSNDRRSLSEELSRLLHQNEAAAGCMFDDMLHLICRDVG